MEAIIILLTVVSAILVTMATVAEDEGAKFLCAILTLVSSVSLGICV